MTKPYTQRKRMTAELAFDLMWSSAMEIATSDCHDALETYQDKPSENHYDAVLRSVEQAVGLRAYSLIDAIRHYLPAWEVYEVLLRLFRHRGQFFEYDFAYSLGDLPQDKDDLLVVKYLEQCFCASDDYSYEGDTQLSDFANHINAPDSEFILLRLGRGVRVEGWQYVFPKVLELAKSESRLSLSSRNGKPRKQTFHLSVEASNALRGLRHDLFMRTKIQWTLSDLVSEAILDFASQQTSEDSSPR